MKKKEVELEREPLSVKIKPESWNNIPQCIVDAFTNDVDNHTFLEEEVKKIHQLLLESKKHTNSIQLKLEAIITETNNNSIETFNKKLADTELKIE